MDDLEALIDEALADAKAVALDRALDADLEGETEVAVFVSIASGADLPPLPFWARAARAREERLQDAPETSSDDAAALFLRKPKSALPDPERFSASLLRGQ